MLDNVTITFSGPPAAILKLLTSAAQLSEHVADSAPASEAVPEQPYSAPNTGAVVSLGTAQFKAFFENMDPRYQEGIRLIAERGGTVSWDELVHKGIHNPGHFKSRTSLRARKVLGLGKRVQFASYFYKVEKGLNVWYLRVTPTTLASMKAYFSQSGPATRSARK